MPIGSWNSLPDEAYGEVKRSEGSGGKSLLWNGFNAVARRVKEDQHMVLAGIAPSKRDTRELAKST